MMVQIREAAGSGELSKAVAAVRQRQATVNGAPLAGRATPLATEKATGAECGWQLDREAGKLTVTVDRVAWGAIRRVEVRMKVAREQDSAPVHVVDLTQDTDDEGTEEPRAKRAKIGVVAVEDPSGQCVCCMDACRTVALKPCWHLCVCESCSNLFGPALEGGCPVCRGEVTGTQRVFV